MDDKLRSGIRRQLEGLAQTLVRADDQKAAVGLVETCAALLRTYEKINAAKPVKGDALEDVIDAFRGISRYVKSFADQLRVDDAEAAEQVAPAGAADLLTTAQDEYRRILKKRDQFLLDLEAQRAKNQAVLRELMQLKDDYANACAQHRRMEEELESFYPDGYNEQLRQNALLNSQLEQAGKQMDEAQQEHARLTNQLNEIKERISRLEGQISEIPEETRVLGAEFVEQEQFLERLRRAEEEFTPERREALEEEIAQTEERNAGLERAVRELENTRNSLKDVNIQLDSEQHRLQTDVLERINACLTGLKEAAGLHKEDIDSIRKTADELRGQLDICEQMRRDYAEWLEADMNPMETIRSVLSRHDPLDAELSKALDPTKDGRIRELNSSVRKELEEMDVLLRECFAAAGRDRSVISNKVRNVRKA